MWMKMFILRWMNKDDDYMFWHDDVNYIITWLNEGCLMTCNDVLRVHDKWFEYVIMWMIGNTHDEVS